VNYPPPLPPPAPLHPHLSAALFAESARLRAALAAVEARQKTVKMMNHAASKVWTLECEIARLSRRSSHALVSPARQAKAAARAGALGAGLMTARRELAEAEALVLAEAATTTERKG